MSKPQTRCVFCGEPGATKGHIWPDWLSDFIGLTALGHTQEEGTFATFETSFPKNSISIKDRQGALGQRKPRNTCKECNGKWMSRIEDAAKRRLVPLVVGEPKLFLSPVDQIQISALLCLISMRLEFIGEQRAVSKEHRDFLRSTAIPSSVWKIWIARFEGNDPYEHWARKYALRLVSEPHDIVSAEDCNIYVSTYAIGKVCAHVVYDVVGIINRYEGVHLTQIWPSSRFDIDTGSLPIVPDLDVLTYIHECIARDINERSSSQS